MDREDFQWKNKEHILELEQFQGKKGQGLPLLYFPLLLAHTGVKNCFTTREGGCSTGMFQSLNLSFTRGDDPQAVTENYRSGRGNGRNAFGYCLFGSDPYDKCPAGG